MKKILYIDMDGVIADFDSQFALDFVNNPDQNFPQSQVDFFRKLPEIRGAVKSIKSKLKQHFDIYFLSSPSSKNPMSYIEKMLWIRDKFGEWGVNRLILTKHKYLNKGDYLIDDRPEHGGNDKFEGEIIDFGSYPFSQWVDVVKYLYEKEAIVVR